MKRRRSQRRTLSALRIVLATGAVLVLAVGVAYTATNVVPNTKAGDETVSDLPQVPMPPGECSGITTTSTVSGSGIVTGTAQNDWLIGSDSIDTMDALGGDDCIEGKDGADIITGGPGNDVCLGGGGLDTFVACETQIQ